jgi:hypothetical protein
LLYTRSDCPWINSCVAIFNQKYFILFLFYTCLCCLYSGVLLVARFISCTNHLKSCSIGGGQAALCIINFVEALVFGLFTLIMMFDQFSAIFENTPGIDALQNKKGERRGRYDSLIAVFGEPLSLRWLLPFHFTPLLANEFIFECDDILLEEPMANVMANGGGMTGSGAPHGIQHSESALPMQLPSELSSHSVTSDDSHLYRERDLSEESDDGSGIPMR